MTLFIISLVLIGSCAIQNGDLPILRHDQEGVAVPWTKIQLEPADNFSFAIISDMWSGYREGVLDVAIAQINLVRPELVLSVGDLIDGGTEDEDQLNREWDHFDSLAHRIKAPFFYTGGNHDLTNTTMRKVWKERLGKRYYHFVYKNVLFLVLDSEDYGDERMQEIYTARAEAIQMMESGQGDAAVESAYFKMSERRTGEISTDQSEYFLEVLENNKDVRWTFLLMHKPVWMRDDEFGLSRIEEALEGRNYTSINGHFHTFSRTVRNGMNYLMLATTGGGQNDQSEMAFDHWSLVTMTQDGPSIAHLRLEGVLNIDGQIPLVTEEMCFQASNCEKSNED